MQVSRPPLRLIWGEGSLKSLRFEMARVGCTRPMVLHTASLRGSPIVERTRALVNAVAAFDQVRAHTPAAAVLAAADLARRSHADCLVALGGGSVAVTARAVAIVLAEGEDLSSLATRSGPSGEIISPRLDRPKLPIIGVPTTPSTAHGKAGTAVTPPGRARRWAMLDPKTRAAALILDPSALSTAPSHLVRDSALTTFAMAVEGMTTLMANPVADADLAKAVALMSEHLPAALDSGNAGTVRTELALAAVLAGSGTDSAGGGVTAALSHTIGHVIAQHNGPIDAVLLPHVLAHMGHESPRSLDTIADTLGSPVAEVASTVTTMLSRFGAPTRLRDLAMPLDALATLASDAMADYASHTSGRPADAETLEAILRRAW